MRIALYTCLLSTLACGDQPSEPSLPGPPAACVSLQQLLPPEAGFFALDQQPLGPLNPAAKVRMFYSFQPADLEGDCKPLVIFFQGGPFTGVIPLWGGNTGPRTLDPLRTGMEPIAPNPFSWTRFANLLYVDSPFAGFSYIQDAPTASDTFVDPYAEAATFVRALIGFVDQHPSLARVPVVLVGESYGGLRATLMLEQLLHFDELRSSKVYRDPALAEDLERYLRRALDAPSGALRPAQIGAHFAQVLIQPFITDAQQLPYEGLPTPAQQAYLDDMSQRVNQMTARLVDPVVLRALTGVAIESITAMFASARTPGLVWEPNRKRADGADETALAALFGVLPAGVSYYTLGNGKSSARVANHGALDAAFSDALHHVRTLITNSPGDFIINSADLAEAITTRLEPKGAREPLSPRVEDLVLRFSNGDQRRVRFPRYDQSGHAVSMYEPELLANDVREWLEAGD